MPYSQYKVREPPSSTTTNPCQEVVEHTTRAPVATLYTTASKDFGQARQILETMQVILVLVVVLVLVLLLDQ